MAPRGPDVLVARSAADRILAEVERWARAGLAEAGRPYEAIAYPLSALVRRRARSGGPSPLEPARPGDLAAIVVADVAIPPDTAKRFGTHNCHFEGPDLGAVNAAFNDGIAASIAGAPALEVHTKLHSHPFDEGAWLSSMDVQVNALAPGAVAWRERLGLASALLQICYPKEPPAKMLRRSQRGRWGIATFAVDPDGEIARLRDARVVPDAHTAIARARASAYWQSDEGRRWDDAQKAALLAAGWPTSRGRLRRGWRRFLVTAGGRDLCVCVPPVPAEDAVRVLEVVDAARNVFRPLPLPRAVAAARSIAEIDLAALVRRYDRRVRRRRVREAA